MTYHSTQIQIMEMSFSHHVNLIEFLQWLKCVEIFLKNKQTFVLVMRTEAETTFPDEYRQIQAVWYKKYKTDFFKYCLGLVRIASDEADQRRLNTPALHTAWKVPYHVTLARTDALQWAIERWS